MKVQKTFLAAGCLALNLSLAKSASLLSLPVYLDSVGTIIGSALLPLPLALSVAVLTSLLGGILISPYFAAYVVTQCSIALVAFLAHKMSFFSSWWKAVLIGLLIALVAALVSAPVTVILFGGVTLSGTTAINAVLMAAGRNIWQSVLGGSLFIESIDKPAASFLAWLTIRRLPEQLHNTLKNPSLAISGEDSKCS